MDIKLKNNKSINLRILILGLCITFLPIILGVLFIILITFFNIHVSHSEIYIMGKGCLILCLILVVMFLINTAKDKTLTFKETYVIRIYSRMFLEVRILLVIAIITHLFSLSELVFHEETFSEQTLLILFVTFVLAYFAQMDFYKLSETNELENYIYEKSILYKLYYTLVKEGILLKSIKSKIIVSIVVFILYIILIFSIGYTMGYLYIGPYQWPSILLFIRNNCLLVILVIFATVAIVISLLYLFRDIELIKIMTYNIANGNYNSGIKIEDPLFFKYISKNLIEIENGINASIDKAVTSERMKSELITNVSHDLKTPLTSIINYVDLLDSDNISEEKRKAYLEILKERSLRLKVLIEDLFEASKAASGNLEMHMESLDPIALLRQTLGEFDDKISISNLEFIKNIPDQKLSIYADGKKTFRVFQNLISNILKYSLSGTRVYIDVEEKDEFVSIIFKNISKYPLNFTEKEILERFKRGDSSRTTEGSGLGLSIAKSLVELQKGTFKLNFDGDLFKVSILLQKENFHSR